MSNTTVINRTYKRNSRARGHTQERLIGVEGGDGEEEVEEEGEEVGGVEGEEGGGGEGGGGGAAWLCCSATATRASMRAANGFTLVRPSNFLRLGSMSY
jgi:hypothetical protein